jgi:hypothetical protein
MGYVTMGTAAAPACLLPSGNKNRATVL